MRRCDTWVAILTGACIAGLMFEVGASEFRIMGTRALSMGGAGVAQPSPSYAAYYNPAALAVSRDGSGFSLSLGGAVRDSGITEHLDVFTECDWEEATGNPAGTNAATIISELLKIESGDGALVLPGMALSVNAGPVGVGVFASAQIGVYVKADKENIRTELDVPNSFTNNQSALYAKALGLVEVPVAYAREFELDWGKLCVGGAVKYIQGFTFNAEQHITEDSDDVEEEMTERDTMSTGIGIDLGVLYRTPGEAFSVGLLTRNINSPEFDTVEDETFKEDMQVRAGIAYDITDTLCFAADLDLTANETLVPNYESRLLGGGFSWWFLRFIGINAGLMTNLAADDIEPILCLGVALGTENVHLQVAAAVSDDEVAIADYPLIAQGVIVAFDAQW